MMAFLDFHHHKYYQSGNYNLNLKEKIPPGSFSAGLHPKDITENWKQDFDNIKKISLDKNCLAIGECGLDGLIATDEALQSEIFKSHLSWAVEIRKPVIIHCVRRFSQLLHYKNSNASLIVHGFNKKETIADALLDAGFYLSFGHAALENLSLQNIIKKIPIQRLFLETDDSDFDLFKLYEKVSQIKSLTPENLNDQMWENLNQIISNG